MKKEQTIFGENFKYILILTALAYIVYTLPAVRGAIAGINSFQPAEESVSN